MKNNIYIKFLLCAFLVCLSILSFAGCEGCKNDNRDTEASDNKDSNKELNYELNKDGNSYSVVGIGTCDDVNLVIPQTYENKPVLSIAEDAFKNCSSLISVTLPDGLEYIGDNAFFGCSSIVNINIPNSVTDIGHFVFYDCVSLQYNVDNSLQYLGDESNKYIYLAGAVSRDLVVLRINENCKFIGSEAFVGYSSLKSVIIPDSVVSIGLSSFYNCVSLENVEIGESVKKIDTYAFSDCSSLVNVNIPNSVEIIASSAFLNCSSLSFNQKDGLKYLGNDSNQYILLLGSVENSLMLASVDNNCKFILMHSFYYHGSLVGVNISDGVKTIGQSCFSFCNSLKNVVIGKGVTEIEYGAFEGCGVLENISYNGSVAEWNKIVKGYGWHDGVVASFVQCSDGIVPLL